MLKDQRLKGGASVAISKDGKVVFARSFGWADNSDSIPLSNQNTLRVASVSKLVTAVAIMHLVEEGRLSLDQKVFGPSGILNDDKYCAIRDKRLLKISVKNLLEHSAGWASQQSGDAMFSPHRIAFEEGHLLPLSMDDILRFTVCRHLDFDPGTHFAYSNLGYAILGEVISKVSHVPYEDYVRSHVLLPLGISSARVGFSHRQDAFPLEPLYYEPDTNYRTPDYADASVLSRRPYGGSDINTLGAAGGWLFSATDLLKLLLSIDGFPSVPDQLPESDVRLLSTPSSVGSPLGWRSVSGGLWWRSGTLAGTSAAAFRRPDGICFVIILNCSNDLGINLASLIGGTLSDAVNRVGAWPDSDLLADDVDWSAYKNGVGARLASPRR
ncbi:MAG: beta-lactamase family protein [Bacteroidales bacterium]|jgi:CubicO group peptidase (beta-lactamase class C family)|nr:beta-lactamase family protein [Bacteroidales bacterium]